MVFGQVFTRAHVRPTGWLTYLEFMTPGVLAQSVLFTAIFYGIAIIWERDLGLLHKMLVLFFASNAIYPIDMMPNWLKTVAHLNPLTYLVDMLRALMVAGGRSTFGLGLDLAIELGVLLLLIVIAARLYPTVAR